MLQIIVTLLLIMMLLPFGGHAADLQAIPYATPANREAIISAFEAVTADEAPIGTRADFDGGFYQIVGEGHLVGREDIH